MRQLLYNIIPMNQQSNMNHNNQKSHHTYQFIKKVGSGNFGEAHLVLSTINNHTYIMKKISLQNRSKQSKQQILREIKLMQNLNHPYVIQYRESFVSRKHVCIVMECAQQGDLQKYLQLRKAQSNPMTQQAVIIWFIQLALALKYIHEKKIVHRDIKPDNIFINNANQLKVGDFGISKLMSETFDLAKTQIGTPNVMAPEIWQNLKYNQKSDIWSLGCVLYKMMTLKFPFEAENNGALVYKIMNHKIAPVLGDYSNDLKALVLEMLDIQPQKRPSIHQILESPLVKQHIAHTLETTITLYDENLRQADQLKKSTSSKLMSKKSKSSLSNSILSMKNVGNGNQYLKVIQYKQNYPMLQEQNRLLKQEIQNITQQRQRFEAITQKLVIQLQESDLPRDQLIQQFEQHILNYLYP